jgi:hypothetical protein
MNDNDLQRVLFFSEHRHLDSPAPSDWTEGLKTVLLINAFLAVGLGIFYELLQLCQQWDVSPWLSAALYVIGHGLWFRRAGWTPGQRRRRGA